ncbi:hypothetical protein [Pontibacter populi]|uniref:Uncharacterized protein n=1 Tax=Pontibacter populi TaxID=890055 RepID=A0ABV1RPE4_9BACT
MKTTEIKEIRDSIVEAMKISAQKLILQKKELGQPIVISENGVIKTISPDKIK